MNKHSEWLNINIVFYYKKIKFTSSSHPVIFFLLNRPEYFCTNNNVKMGNDVINTLTSEDMENMPLESQM